MLTLGADYKHMVLWIEAFNYDRTAVNTIVIVIFLEIIISKVSK